MAYSSKKNFKPAAKDSFESEKLIKRQLTKSISLESL